MNKNLTMMIIISYISLIIIGLYVYRFYKINNILDLKILIKYYSNFKILEIPFIFKFYFILHIILILIIIILLILNIHKYSKLELYKFYVFCNYNLFLQTNKYTKCFFRKFNIIRENNIFSFIINQITFNILLFLKELEINHGAKYKEFEFPTYKFRVLSNIITTHKLDKIKHIYTFDLILYYIIPLIIIIYDIIFNDYILKHIFYYLIIIIPVKIFQNITKVVFETDSRITDLMWEIYYKEEDCIYACTKEQKLLLDIYIKNGLQMLPGLDLVFLSENLYVFNNSPLRFKLISSKNKLYQNDFGTVMQEQNNGELLEVKDYLFDDENEYIEYGENLIKIADKRNISK